MDICIHFMCSAFQLINDVIIETVRYIHIQSQSINKHFVKEIVHDMYYIIKLNKQIKLMNNKSVTFIISYVRRDNVQKPLAHL